jgi:hypothetical protein
MKVAETLGLEPKMVEGKNEDQLVALEEAMQLVGSTNGAKPGGISRGSFAGGGTGGKSNEGLTSREKIIAGLDIASKKG